MPTASRSPAACIRAEERRPRSRAEAASPSSGAATAFACPSRRHAPRSSSAVRSGSLTDLVPTRARCRHPPRHSAARDSLRARSHTTCSRAGHRPWPQRSCRPLRGTVLRSASRARAFPSESQAHPRHSRPLHRSVRTRQRLRRLSSAAARPSHYSNTTRRTRHWPTGIHRQQLAAGSKPASRDRRRAATSTRHCESCRGR